jgi:hypothetical protein
MQFAKLSKLHCRCSYDNFASCIDHGVNGIAKGNIFSELLQVLQEATP